MIASVLNLSQSAVILGISQSTLSRQLQALEAQFGARLVERTGHGVTLTKAGRRLVLLAQPLLEQADTLLQDMRLMGSEPGGKVTIAMPPIIAEPLLYPLLQRFRADFPHVELHVREAMSGYALEWVTSAQVDLAIVYSAPRYASLKLEPLLCDPLLLIGSSEDPLMDGTPIPARDVVRLPLLLPGSRHGQRGIINRAAWQLGMQPHIAMELDSFPLIVKFVAQRLGYTCLPYAAVASWVAQGSLAVRPIVEPELEGELSLAFATKRHASPAVRLMYRYIVEEIERLRVSGLWCNVPTHAGSSPVPPTSHG